MIAIGIFNCKYCDWLIDWLIDKKWEFKEKSYKDILKVSLDRPLGEVIGAATKGLEQRHQQGNRQRFRLRRRIHDARFQRRESTVPSENVQVVHQKAPRTSGFKATRVDILGNHVLFALQVIRRFVQVARTDRGEHAKGPAGRDDDRGKGLRETGGVDVHETGGGVEEQGQEVQQAPAVMPDLQGDQSHGLLASTEQLALKRP